MYKRKRAHSAGDNLLSLPVKASTIGSRGLDCRVRNEIGYDPSDESPALQARFACKYIQIERYLKNANERLCYPEFRTRDWAY